MTLPDDLVHQFRSVALERLERVEAAWAQVLTSLNDEAATLIHREIHTLKGESRVVAFTDVNLVCHKLEDLLEVARARGYAVDEDFDLAVNMALRFMAMLIRKKVGSHLSGIDLPGFIRQIDNILNEARHEHAGRNRPGSVPPLLRTGSSSRVSPALRDRLSPIAVDAFIEYAVAKGARRDRLRTSWHALRDLIGIQRAVVGAGQLSKYKASVQSLARDLGKQVDVSFELGTAEVTTEVLSAIDTATLHLLRNAVDHGIEPQVDRGPKSPTGRIRLRGGMRDEGFVLTVEDDGRGIDFERVRTRAVELGLITSGTSVDRARLVDLMCHPGFTTRSEASETSGRGVGLDAVRGNVVECGGTLTATSEWGKGTTFTVTIPVPPLSVHGHVIRAPAIRFPVVIAPGWRVLDRPPEKPIIVDLGAALGLSPSSSISTTPWFFTNGQIEVGILCGAKPVPVQARRLIATPPTTVAEIATIDSVEGLLLRPERIPGVL
ncbi:MAG TPA: ATP-binding protein [Kofleriaceae bacterium]|nr:ATP-binding protein [Kofleriaceae bacterium]